MNRSLNLGLLILALSLTSFGQKLGKPTITPSQLTPAQQKTLQEGVALHDAKRYDEAIAKYKSILDENPDCVAAMYELSMTLDTKGSTLEAMELARKGTRYIADELPLFYVLIANNLDDLGKSDDAVKIYQDGLKILEGDSRFSKYRARLYFNLGVTYLKLKKDPDARQAFKLAVENDFSYASPHYFLSMIYQGGRYKIPAFLAACRFVSLEFNTGRTANAVATIVNTLKAAPKDPKTGSYVINLDFGAPKDEGDFGGVELLLGTLMTVKDDKDKNKTENELFVDALNTVVALIAEDKKLATTFVGKNYSPYMAEMKKSGNLEAFGYMVLYLSGKEDALTWLGANEAKLQGLIKWAKAYQPTVR